MLLRSDDSNRAFCCCVLHVKVVLFSPQIGEKVLFNNKALTIFLTSSILFVQPVSSWERPAEVDPGVWQLVEPYLLPEDHKICSKIKKIFSESAFRVTESFHTLHEAGFKLTGTDHTLNFRVVKHKAIKGWLFKIYTDDNTQELEWPHFIARCQGAQAASAAIHANNATNLFKVPKKYIVPIPQSGSTSYSKHFILAVKEMDLVSKESNKKKWGATKAMPDFLNIFWKVITTAGLSDNMNIYNSPWCYDGTIAFVDTEHFHEWPVHYPNLLIRLRGQNHAHWKSLINRGGP